MSAFPLSDLHVDDRTFRAMLETIPDAALLVDSSGRLTALNEVAERVFGWPEPEIVGRPLEELIPRRYKAEHPRLVREYFATPQVILGANRFRHGEEVELKGLRQNGDEFPVEISVGPIETADGAFALAIVRDVSESRRLRAQLREYNRDLEGQVRRRTAEIEEKQAELLQAAKVASLGALTAGVVHQLNTPLGALSSAAQTALSLARRLVAQSDGDEMERWNALLDDITRVSEEAIRQLNQTVAGLRLFSRIDFEEESVADLGDGLRSALNLLGPATANRIRVESDFRDIPSTRARHADLNQAFMNVLLNAVEAIPAQGAIRAAAFEREGQAVITVTDTGVGIAPADLAKIFEPGYTTKGARVGSGLGLAIVKRVIDEHDGAVLIESREGEGSTVTLRIPLKP